MDQPPIMMHSGMYSRSCVDISVVHIVHQHPSYINWPSHKSRYNSTRRLTHRETSQTTRGEGDK